MKKSQLKLLIKEIVLEAMSRRDFLKNLAVGGAGFATGYGLSKLHRPYKPSQQTETPHSLDAPPTGWAWEVIAGNKNWIVKGPISYKGNTYTFNNGTNDITINSKGVKIGGVEAPINETMNRRDFLKKAAIGGLGAVAGYTVGKYPKGSSKKSPTTAKSSWGSPGEKRLVGHYQSNEPPYVLDLFWEGTCAVKSLQSGDEDSGKWSVQGSTLITIWDSNGSQTTYNINSDGSFESSRGILFVKTE